MKFDSRKHRLFAEGPSDGATINKIVLKVHHEDIAKPRLVTARGDDGEGGFTEVIEQVTAEFEIKKMERFGAVIDRDGRDGKPDRWNTL